MDKITTVITCIATVAAAIAAICFCITACNSNAISKRQLGTQQSEHQPIFRVNSNLLKDENSPVFNNEVLTITYEGHSPKQVDSVQVNTYFEIDRNYNGQSDTIYVPVVDYFTASHTDINGGTIYVAYGPDNNKYFGLFYNECINKSKTGTFYFTTKLHLVKIDYVDIDGISHTTCFIKNKLAEQKQYDKIISESKAAFTYNLFDISKLQLEDV